MLLIRKIVFGLVLKWLDIFVIICFGGKCFRWFFLIIMVYWLILDILIIIGGLLLLFIVCDLVVFGRLIFMFWVMMGAVVIKISNSISSMFSNGIMLILDLRLWWFCLCALVMVYFLLFLLMVNVWWCRIVVNFFIKLL